MNTLRTVIELATKSGAKMVRWQHVTSPIRGLTDEVFSEGLGFDGLFIRGWKITEASETRDARSSRGLRPIRD